MKPKIAFYLGALVVALQIASGSAFAAEPALDFLAALRDEGWNDTALAYLDSLGDAKNLPEGQRQRLPYERAVTQAAAARSVGNAERRRQLIEEAATALNAVADQPTDSTDALDALRQAANLHAELAFGAIARRDRLPAAAAQQRRELTENAQASFESASAAAEAVLGRTEQQLTALPKAAVAQADPKAMAARDRLETRRQEARFLIAKLLYEMAKTHDPGSKPYNDGLAAAAKAFQQLFVDYENKLVGFYGRLYEGRCYQEASLYEKALGCYQDLIEVNTTNANFRQLMAQAMRSRVETLIAQEKLADAIESGRDWLQRSQSSERQQPEWLGVAYRLADALNRQREKLPKGDAQSTKWEAEARLLWRDVAQTPNQWQQEARLALATLGRTDGEAPTEFGSFGEAFAAAKNSLELRKSSQLAARLARANNPGAVAELEEQAEQNNARSIKQFEQALVLANRETLAADLNAARYFLSVLYWETERTPEAAVLSEFLARQYPDNHYAESASRVALAAFEKLYHLTRKDSRANESLDGEFYSQKLAELAELIAGRWPDSQQAGAAVNLLINIALADDRVADAEKLLARLPKESKVSAELSLGGAMWRKYLTMTAEAEDAPSDDAVETRNRAAELLQQGFAAARTRGEPSATTATGALYFTQLLLSDGDAKSALEVLEDKTIGPLTLVKENHAAASRPDFIQSTYKTALRAYLAMQPPRRNEAQQMMESLEASAGDGAQLTRVYVSLGLQLQQQIKQLTAAGKTQEARSVAEAFEDLLQRVAARDDANSWSIRNWLAQTNLQLGEVLAGEEREQYIQRAKESYEKILASAEQDKQFAPSPTALLAVRKRLADCELGLGNFEDALDQYAAILKQKPNMLELQEAAAETYQQQGVADKDPVALKRAIFGAMPQGDKNLVWGWLQLAKVVDYAKRRAESNPAAATKVRQYENLFFAARFHAAKARFQMASVGPTADRIKNLQTAERSVRSMQILYPTLGGPKWKAAFEGLLEQINQASK